jgi:hypothetical protein
VSVFILENGIIAADVSARTLLSALLLSNDDAIYCCDGFKAMRIGDDVMKGKGAKRQEDRTRGGAPCVEIRPDAIGA